MQNAKCKMKEGLTPLLRFALFDLMQNAERRTQNAERRTQNAERRTQNAERRTKNAECRMQNAERITNFSPNSEFRICIIVPNLSFGFGF